MSHFKTPVDSYARGPTIGVALDAPLEHVLATIEQHDVSAVPVLDPAGRPLGVISRTDLLRIGTPRPRDAAPGRTALVVLPQKVAADVMHRGVITIARTASVAEAAKIMVDRRIHRVFVTDEQGSACDVFGTREIMRAIWDSRVPTPIGTVMSRKAFTVPVDAPVSLATQRLELAHAQGLVVLDPEGWPIGLFTQREALLARGFDPAQTVEHAMSHAMLCLHATTQLHRAAAQAAYTRARRVLVVEERKLVGVLTGLDFARLTHPA